MDKDGAMLTSGGNNLNNMRPPTRNFTEATLNNRVIQTNLFITKVGFINYGLIIKSILFIGSRILLSTNAIQSGVTPAPLPDHPADGGSYNIIIIIIAPPP